MKEIIFIVPILCSIYIISNIKFYKSKSEQLKNKIDWNYYLIFIAIIGLQAFNTINFLTDNFIFNSVYSHSEKNLEIAYKITATFSGKEGSFLLWITSFGIVGLFFNKIIKKITNIKIIFLCKAIFITFPLFLSIALFWNNPFELTSGNINITDGLGLKPTLQSYYNLIHPPFIFIGFSMLYIPYVITISILLSKSDINNKILNTINLFNKLGILFLTAGIITGSLWAYRTLGWGGFWGWDPIENAALIPLLLAFALLHFSIINQKSNNKNSFLKTIFLLSILIFPSIVLCTFLARSGLLINNSVHSYVNSNSNIITYILLFLFFILMLLPLFLFFIRINFLNIFQQTINKNNLKNTLIISGTIIIFCITFVVLCGTLIPVISSKIANLFIEINSNFYMMWATPLTTIMLLLLGISTLLKEKKYHKSKFIKTIIFPFTISTILTFVLLFNETDKLKELIFFFACIFVIASQLQKLITKIIKIKTIKLKYFSSFLSHIGVAIFLMGAVLYGTFKQEEIIKIEKNKLFETKYGLQCIINEIRTKVNKKYSYIIPEVNINYKKNNFNLKPKIVLTRVIKNNKETNINNNESFTISMFPDIVSIGLTDIYVEPLNNKTTVTKPILLSISIKPYINFVWIGFVIIFIGLILSIISHNY